MAVISVVKLNGIYKPIGIFDGVFQSVRNCDGSQNTSARGCQSAVFKLGAGKVNLSLRRFGKRDRISGFIFSGISVGRHHHTAGGF